MSGLMKMSRPLRIRRPLSMPAPRMIDRADAVARAFDYEPEKAIPVPPGACAHYGKELPTDLVCPATCPVIHECYAALQEASK